jgi:hypothetical protein
MSFESSWENGFLVKYQSKKLYEKWLKHIIPMAQMVHQSELR